jgi:hypothetical protein
MADFLEKAGDKTRAAKVRSCGKFLRLGWDGHTWENDGYGEHPLTGDFVRLAKAKESPVKVLDGDLCDQYKLCPLCAHLQSMRRFAKIMPQVVCLLHSKQEEYLPVLVTLTVKNGPDITERFKHLMDSLKRLHQLAKDAKKGRRWTEAARIAGAVWSTEFTFSEATGWHPHLHGICLIRRADLWMTIPDEEKPGHVYPYPINVSSFREDWLSVTGDSHVFRVDPFDCCTSLLNVPETREQICKNPDLVAGGLLEGMKYATKMLEGNHNQRFSVHNATFSKHLIRRWGVLRKVDPCPVMSRRNSPPLVGEWEFNTATGKYEPQLVLSLIHI